jgi:Flp pilus assembly protein TadD
MVPLEQALNLKPNSDEVLALLANCNLDRGQTKKALELANLAIAANPENAMAYAVIGTAQQSLNHNAEARTAYEKYLKLAPKGEYASDVRSVLNSLH